MQDTTQCEFQCQMVGCPMNDVAFEREIVEVFGLESTVRERTRALDRNKRLQAADKHKRHGCDIPGPHGTGPPSLPSRGSHDRFLGVPWLYRPFPASCPFWFSVTGRERLPHRPERAFNEDSETLLAHLNQENACSRWRAGRIFR